MGDNPILVRYEVKARFHELWRARENERVAKQCDGCQASRVQQQSLLAVRDFLIALGQKVKAYVVTIIHKPALDQHPSH